MSLNSIKTLSLAMSLLVFVACGQGNRNMKVDGAYQVDDGGDQTKKKPVVLMDIKDNVATTYRFSNDGKSVEIMSDKLVISGNKVVRSAPVKNMCDRDEEADNSIQVLKKTNNSLEFHDTDDNGNDVIATNLIKISGDQIASIQQDIKEGKIKQDCINPDGTAAKKVISDDQVSEDKSDVKSDVKADDKTDAKVDENSTGSTNVSADAKIEDKNSASTTDDTTAQDDGQSTEKK